MIKIIEELCMQTMTFLSKSLNQQAGAIINASIIKDDIIKSHQQRRDIYTSCCRSSSCPTWACMDELLAEIFSLRVWFSASSSSSLKVATLISSVSRSFCRVSSLIAMELSLTLVDPCCWWDWSSSLSWLMSYWSSLIVFSYSDSFFSKRRNSSYFSCSNSY